MKNSTARLCAPQLKLISNSQLTAVKMVSLATEISADQTRFKLQIIRKHAVSSRSSIEDFLLRKTVLANPAQQKDVAHSLQTLSLKLTPEVRHNIFLSLKH
jgi:hypothetical protein